MKTLVPAKYKKLLWKDEVGDTFILLKYAEIYRYSDTILKMVIWSYKQAQAVKKLGIVLAKDSTDDGLYIYDIHIRDLDKAIDMGGSFTNRFRKESKWIKDKEKRLAHRIIPYNGKLGKE
jgi:hypothetical protein